MNGIDIDAIRTRLQRAAAGGRGKMLPPVPEAELAAFEQAEGIALPGPYREFLREVCDGFLGDCGTLRSFKAACAKLPAPLATPFPYQADDSARIRDGLAAGGSLSALMADPAIRSRQVQGYPPGCIAIGDLGDPEPSVLVISGQERGRVWRIGDFDAPETNDLYLGNGDRTPIDYGEWIMHWLTMGGF